MKYIESKIKSKVEKELETEEKNSHFACWKNRSGYNDYIFCECSNCHFHIEAYKAVEIGNSSTDYKDVKYNFCPKCGKKMLIPMP